MVIEINGLKLPTNFVEDLQNGRLHVSVGSHQLRKEKNAWDEPLETELGWVFEDVNQIQKETDKLPEGYTFLSVEEVEDYTKLFGVQPGEIAYFWDFSKVVCFAMAGDGAPFCFDFRDNEEEPSVIWWADDHWQRIAPNYETFMGLFEIQ